MLRALGQLLVRGAVSLGIVAVTVLCLTGFLSLIATSFQPKKQAIAETITNGNCKPGQDCPFVRRRLAPASISSASAASYPHSQ
jgi:hypothetical protein